MSDVQEVALNEEAQSAEEQAKAIAGLIKPMIQTEINAFLNAPGLIEQLAKNVLLAAVKSLDSTIKLAANRNVPHISSIYYPGSHHAQFVTGADNTSQIVLSECTQNEAGEVVTTGQVDESTPELREAANLLRQIIGATVNTPVDGQVVYVTTVGAVSDAVNLASAAAATSPWLGSVQ